MVTVVTVPARASKQRERDLSHIRTRRHHIKFILVFNGYTMTSFRFTSDRELLNTVLRFDEIISHTSGNKIRSQVLDPDFAFASVMLNQTDGRVASVAVVHYSTEMESALRIVSIGCVPSLFPAGVSVKRALGNVVIAAIQVCSSNGFINVFADNVRPFSDMGFTEYTETLMHYVSFNWVDYKVDFEVAEWVFSGTEVIMAVRNFEGFKKIPEEFANLFRDDDVIDVTCGGAIGLEYLKDLLFDSDVDLECMFVIRNADNQLTGIAVLGVVPESDDHPSYGELFILCSNRYLVSAVRGKDIMQRILQYFKCNRGVKYVHLTAAGTTLYANNYPSMGFSGGTVEDIVQRGCDSGVVPLLHEVHEKGCYHMTRCLKDITSTTPVTLFPINQAFGSGISNERMVEIQYELDAWRNKQTLSEDIWKGMPDLVNMTNKSANDIADDPYINISPYAAMDIDDSDADSHDDDDSDDDRRYDDDDDDDAFA